MRRLIDMHASYEAFYNDKGLKVHVTTEGFSIVTSLRSVIYYLVLKAAVHG